MEWDDYVLSTMSDLCDKALRSRNPGRSVQVRLVAGEWSAVEVDGDGECRDGHRIVSNCRTPFDALASFLRYAIEAA